MPFQGFFSVGFLQVGFGRVFAYAQDLEEVISTGAGGRWRESRTL